VKKIRFAVVGVGHIGKRHAEMICRNPEAELGALIDIKPKDVLNIESFKAPFFSSLQSFLDSDLEVDVVNIATPNGLHAQQALQCLEKNMHVVIEKPLALNSKDVEEVINKAKDKNKLIFPVMQNRYSPPSQWVKEIVKGGILGKVFMVQLNCYWNRDERYYTGDTWHGTKEMDGGTLFTQFSHFIDILYWLFGDINNIKVKLECFNHEHLTSFEDSGIVTFDIKNGGVGSINFSTSIWNKNMESSLTVIAENGSIKIGGQYMDKVEYCHIKDYSMPDMSATNDGHDYGDYKGSAANHHYVIDNVVDVIMAHSEIATTALEGLKVIDIIERIYHKGHAQNR
jgi:UDP-N-acetyl-2-amino-2-deoxyglucuronate dehydrogenase